MSRIEVDERPNQLAACGIKDANFAGRTERSVAGDGDFRPFASDRIDSAARATGDLPPDGPMVDPSFPVTRITSPNDERSCRRRRR